MNLETSLQMEYGTFVHLSDHTGTYSRCLLASIAMEKLLGYSVEEFLHLPLEKRVRLKWEFCLRRFKVGLLLFYVLQYLV